MSELAEDQVQLGYVAGTHGVAGALKVRLFNPESSALDSGVRVALRQRDGTDAREFEIDQAIVKPGSDQVRVRLVGVETREAADALRGRGLWIARADLPALADDEFYLGDLIGREVVRARDDASFESLGEIVGVTSNTAQDLFTVRLRGREWLLPAFAPFIVTIEAERVVVDVHDELLPASKD
jgi:16S rRNA processing protein RimM